MCYALPADVDAILCALWLEIYLAQSPHDQVHQKQKSLKHLVRCQSQNHQRKFRRETSELRKVAKRVRAGA